LNQLGAVESVVVINRDLTSQKNKTEKLLQSAKYFSASHLASEVAHHINNPLAIINFRCQHLKNKIEQEGAASPKVISDIENIFLAVERIKKIVNSMSDLTQHDLAKDKEINLNIQDAIHLALAMCDEKKISGGVKREIQGCLDVEYPVLTSGFVDALFHILSNAFEAASASIDPWIKIELSGGPRAFSIKVTDSGTTAELKDHDVLPFSSKKGPSSVGLGLSIAKSHLSRLGAALEFQNDSVNTTVEIIFSNMQDKS
jgi:phosphoglycerate-specific signal transduction histidine kinase